MLFGANRDNGANSGSRASNWNNYVWYTNWPIGARFSCEDFIGLYKISHTVKTCADDLKKWSAYLSCYGKHITGSVKVRVVKYRNDKTAIYGKKAQKSIRENCRHGQLERRL